MMQFYPLGVLLMSLVGKIYKQETK